MRVSWQDFFAAVNGCTACDLCRTRTNVVPGEGDFNAKLMLIGEGPGRDEDLQGRPFVGASGALLTKMLAAIDVPREKTYICNVVKCRPPGNRTPAPDEAAACIGFLRQQFALVRPKIVVLLGKTASAYVLQQEIFIGRDHGTWFERKNVRFMPTYHPSALLRDPSLKRAAWEDFQKVRKALDEIDGEDAR